MNPKSKFQCHCVSDLCYNNFHVKFHTKKCDSQYNTQMEGGGVFACKLIGHKKRTQIFGVDVLDQQFLDSSSNFGAFFGMFVPHCCDKQERLVQKIQNLYKQYTEAIEKIGWQGSRLRLLLHSDFMVIVLSSQQGLFLNMHHCLEKSECMVDSFT